jgi:hypothetical protein
MARLAQTRPCIVIFCNICRNTDRMGSTDRYRTVHLIIIHSQISAALNNSDQNFRDDPGINYTIRQDLVERFQERRISRRSGAATASCQLSRAEHSSPPHTRASSRRSSQYHRQRVGRQKRPTKSEPHSQ